MARAGMNMPATAFVSSHAKPGGAERYLELLLGELEPSAIRCVAALEHGPLVARLRAGAYPTVVIPTSASAASIAYAAGRLRLLLERSRPDVVHANGIKAALVTAIAAAGTRLPVVWVKHDFSHDGRLAALVAARCARIVGVSAAVTATFRGRARQRVRVVHNGIHPPVADRQEGRRLMLGALGAPPSARVVALVGRLDPFKGHRELIAALPAVLEHVPDARVAFVGGPDAAAGDHGDRLRAEARAAGLDRVVAFLGQRDDAVALMSGCDALAIVSRPDRTGMGREGFPYVGLEALAVGTPVVAYADGGLPELVGDCGALVPPGDRTALAAAVVAILTDGARRERLVCRGRERVRTSFGVERMAGAMRAIYSEAAAARGGVESTRPEAVSAR